jgi:hypothetical protein
MHRDAASDLKRVVEQEPHNLKARGYLGLALLRAGDLERAQRAFTEAGQDDLAKHVEERIASVSKESDKAMAEVRRIAAAGLRAMDERDLPFAAAEAELASKGAVEVSAEAQVTEQASRGAWQVRAPGAPTPPPGPEGFTAVASSSAPLELKGPQAISDFAVSRLVRTSQAGETFSITEGGMLLVRVDGRVSTRTLGAIVSVGTLAFEPMVRRVRGRATADPFGDGVEAISMASGRGMMIIAPRGATFTPLTMQEDILFLRETAVWAFEETLHWENGRIPGGGSESIPIAQFRGTGRCVMRTLQPVLCVKVEPNEVVYVDHSVLVGWIGRVVPRQLPGEGGQPTPYVECSGEGVLILEEPEAPKA